MNWRDREKVIRTAFLPEPPAHYCQRCGNSGRIQVEEYQFRSYIYRLFHVDLLNDPHRMCKIFRVYRHWTQTGEIHCYQCC